jgi:hypothetical protein
LDLRTEAAIREWPTRHSRAQNRRRGRLSLALFRVSVRCGARRALLRPRAPWPRPREGHRTLRSTRVSRVRLGPHSHSSATAPLVTTRADTAWSFGLSAWLEVSAKRFSNHVRR